MRNFLPRVQVTDNAAGSGGKRENRGDHEGDASWRKRVQTVAFIREIAELQGPRSSSPIACSTSRGAKAEERSVGNVAAGDYEQPFTVGSGFRSGG